MLEANGNSSEPATKKRKIAEESSSSGEGSDTDPVEEEPELDPKIKKKSAEKLYPLSFLRSEILII